MNLQHTSCSYHPNKVAVSICERCRRPICLEDKRIYRRSHSSGTDSHSRRYYTSHEFCVICNSAKLSSDAKWSPMILICFIPFILMFFGMFFLIPFEVSNSGPFDFGFFGYIPMIFIGFIAFFILIMFVSINQTKKKATNAEMEASSFRNSLNNSSAPFTYQKYVNNSFEPARESSGFSSSSSDFNYSEAFSLVCYECGKSISVQDKFCPNCGDSTKEELEKHYSQR
ncbi:MAG: hypothetical protein HeimC3_25050 [Candidatus Heimdallarchaeota archaeon LC_3]|nr:MAG: hypothetical protein HeimC3_25050 [Candidatus Heimdallarchaeota archaeon LC_3]